MLSMSDGEEYTAAPRTGNYGRPYVHPMRGGVGLAATHYRLRDFAPLLLAKSGNMRETSYRQFLWH